MNEHMTPYDRLCILNGSSLTRGGIEIHYPTINEIVAMSYEAYNSMMVIFMTDIKEFFKDSNIPEEELEDITFIDVVLRQESDFKEPAMLVLKTYFNQDFSESIFLNEDGEMQAIGITIQGQPLTSELWESIRLLVLEMNDLNTASEVEPVFTHPKAKEIWEKQKKAEEARNKAKNGGGQTFEDVLCDIISAVCSKSHTITYSNVGDLNVYQLKDHLGKLIEIEAYDLNMMFAAHGAEIKDNKHWSESKSDTTGGK